MTTYRIYTCQDKVPVVVKKGFSWPAFFFNWIWALFCGLFLYVFLMDVATGVIMGLAEGIVAQSTGNVMLARTVGGIGCIVGLVVVGAYANDLKARKLAKEGYVQSGTVDARNELTAMRKLESAPMASEEEKGLNEFQSFKSPESWQCPQCAEQVEGQFSSCWKCGTDRAGRS